MHRQNGDVPTPVAEIRITLMDNGSVGVQVNGKLTPLDVYRVLANAGTLIEQEFSKPKNKIVLPTPIIGLST